MKKILAICLTLAAMTANAAVVYQDSTVRFDLISPSAIRMEYAPDGNFVDNRSLLASERNYPEVPCDVKVGVHGEVRIATDFFELRYTLGSGPFSVRNLAAISKMKDFPFVWHYEKPQTGNLKGTYNGLDMRDGQYKGTQPMPFENGVVATDGWHFIDDSQGLLFDNSEWPWAMKRTGSPQAQDFYFMAYGHDYKRALRDYAAFAGRVPLPPRYAFGYWWSRYWSYTDNEFREMADAFERYDIPIDVMVMDMDWHYIDPERGGWSNYSWNRELFPEPAKFIADMKARGLHVPFNTHPDKGITPAEDTYAQAADFLGVNKGDTIPMLLSSKPFAQALCDIVLRPVERDGADFWWPDFNTWPNDKEMPELNNVWWLAYIHFSDRERHSDKRPLTFTRWGGPGAHRYQLGFSGDHGVSWASLDFQPYFTATAANTLQGFWSHDIGGHFQTHPLTPEMFARWIQFGTFSPILRTHSAKDASLNKEPWNFDKKHFDIIHGMIKLRYALAPYIYTMARKTYDEALAMCRPMYYDYPEAPEAYEMKNEYMFGDKMLFMPITAPMDSSANRSLQKIWLPEGKWYEYVSGELLEGGRTIERNFALEEFPLYIKAGAIVPMSRGLKNLNSGDYPYVNNVWPGADDTFEIYEDNGDDKDYAVRHAFTPVELISGPDNVKVSIKPRRGEYDGMPATRNMAVKINAVRPPKTVTVNGKEMPFSYDGNDMSFIVELGDTDPSQSYDLTADFGRSDYALANGMQAKLKRASRILSYIKNTNPWLPIHGELSLLESAGRKISYNPELFDETVSAFNDSYSRLPQILKDLGYADELIEAALAI